MKKHYWLTSLFIALPLFVTGCQEESADAFAIKTGGFEPVRVAGFEPIEIEGFSPIQIVGFPGIGGKAATKEGKDLPHNVEGTPLLRDIRGYDNSAESKTAAVCARRFLQLSTCLLSEIMPLGLSKNGDLTIEDIERRLVVSHDWMAESFLAALGQINDQELLNLFKPINAVVLSFDVQPSFYHPATASIYLDPCYLWRNELEWKTIHQPPEQTESVQNQAMAQGALMDYREKYQAEFKTEAVSRYVANGLVSAELELPQHTNSRSAGEVAPPLYRLLAHELAHANDYLPIEQLRALKESETVYHGLLTGKPGKVDGYISSIIEPLTSPLLLEAAQVAFAGKPITNNVRQMTGADAGRAFDKDGAARFYGYSKPAEDLATIFEDFMMYHKYGVLPDVAFVKKPAAVPRYCSELIVEWGQRARLADTKVRQKAGSIARELLGRDVSADLPPLSTSTPYIASGQDWCL